MSHLLSLVHFLIVDGGRLKVELGKFTLCELHGGLLLQAYSIIDVLLLAIGKILQD